jgi:hypothetical protein
MNLIDFSYLCTAGRGALLLLPDIANHNNYKI